MGQVTVTARDRAGNTATASVAYSVDSPPGFPLDADTVTIDGQTHVVNGYNRARGEDELIVYTTGGVTSTNQYGVEVAVSSANKVLSVNDRLTQRSTTGTAIPGGGYVLSGHSAAFNYGSGSYAWLKAHAQVGDVVTLFKGGSTPPPVDPPPAGTAGLVELCWHHGWSGPTLGSWNEQVLEATDIIAWGMSQSNGQGTGKLTDPPLSGYSGAPAAKADILAQVAKGKKVLVGFGGSRDGGITITNAAQVAEARASINSMVSRFGFNGISIDLEPSGSSWNQTSLVSLVAGLKADHPGFYVDLCVGLYGEHTAKWIALAKALGSNMDSISVMLYDFPEAGDSRLTGVSVGKVETLVTGGVPASKVILLYMMRPNAGYTNSTPTPSLVVNALVEVLKSTNYPTLRGFGWWEDGINKARNWDGPKAVEAAFVGGSV